MSTALLESAAALDVCDGYVVLVIDPVTGDIDAHGPQNGLDAVRDADRRRGELDAEGLHEVAVSVVRCHEPGPT